jgi:hypothetical protein
MAGRNFPLFAAFRVSAAWLKARTKAETEIAIDRPTRLRFPQGLEVWISGCPKLVAAAKSGLSNPQVETGTELPEHLRWHAVSGFPRS